MAQTLVGIEDNVYDRVQKKVVLVANTQVAFFPFNTLLHWYKIIDRIEVVVSIVDEKSHSKVDACQEKNYLLGNRMEDDKSITKW